MATSKVAVPGQVLGSTSTHTSGPGTHVYESNIYASIIGPILTLPTTSSSTKSPNKPTLTISRSPSSATLQSSFTPLPIVGSTVLCTVTRVQVRQAVCLILTTVPPTTTSPTPTTTFPPSESLNFPALLRREDIRLTEKDRVVMNESVRVGDLIRAQVISIGDERQYYISTAGNEFGVLAAKAEGSDGWEEGGWMTAVSWKEMRDLTAGGRGKGEKRKVAKPA